MLIVALAAAVDDVDSVANDAVLYLCLFRTFKQNTLENLTKWHQSISCIFLFLFDFFFLNIETFI
jgi:hypothetical protein